MYDVCIIGAGPGGYVCAIRCAQNGLKVALVDARETLGGTCLNEGCIPSKALLDSSSKYHEAVHHFSEHGIDVSAKFDLSKMMARKSNIVSKLCSGINMLMKKNKIDVITGFASFESKDKVVVDNKGKKSEILAKNFVIATGSEVSSLPNVEIDGKVIISSTECLSLKSVPKRLTVIGGGVIGLEMASVYARLGSIVNIVEYADQILPAFDKDIAKEASKVFNKQGLLIHTSSKVLSAKASGKTAIVEFEKDGKIEKLESDIVLVATGRRPFTKNLGLDKIGAKLDNRGFIEVDKKYSVSQNIYAIGDVITGAMLAHKAEEEGVAVANIIAGKYAHVNYNVIPSIVYTHPEIATVGASEKDLTSQGIEYSIGKFPFIANSRAVATGNTEGFVKILSCTKTDKILGAAIIGHEAGSLIHEISNLIEFSASAEDLAMICHAHPTMNEAVREAALAVSRQAIHI